MHRFNAYSYLLGDISVWDYCSIYKNVAVTTVGGCLEAAVKAYIIVNVYKSVGCNGTLSS